MLAGIEASFGGQSCNSEDGHMKVPELIAEIASSSASYDLHDKLKAYRRRYRNISSGDDGSKVRLVLLQAGEYISMAVF